jgi:hypothetical protein
MLHRTLFTGGGANHPAGPQVGWGIHYSVRGGWVWNVWGRDCVVVRLNDGGVLQIGTDNAPDLARFLEEKIRQSRE